MDNLKKSIDVNTVWNCCSLNNKGNLPNKEGRYLTINDKGEFEILDFFMKGSTMLEHENQTQKVVRLLVASENSFYRSDENGVSSEPFVMAWAELSDDANKIMNLFVDRK